ncbi:helix-turn-helix domain-containing protein [Halocatena salina]|uniref:Helix-turn-helix domain-containing protein n=1 Tax=Halocatena salina TaxID=2934340 RepID=A0A8U0A0N3_9EURY|nr:helix-turn-helix domain-containing protein [Halocatena salina]UPM42675.1 helix-turn-helix domain-containing protein [Halocatena salina]
MHEAIISVDGDGAYADATAGTDARIELWCTEQRDLLSVVGPSEPVLRRIESAVGISDSIAHDTAAVIVTESCLTEHGTETIDPYFDRHNCLLLPPLRYEGGMKQCRVLALDPSSLTACYRDLTTDNVSVTVESKRAVEIVSPSPSPTLERIVPELTERQRDTLSIAYEHGYYRIPRETTTQAIADRVGVDRRTAEEHLRRAENKLIDSIIQYI